MNTILYSILSSQCGSNEASIGSKTHMSHIMAFMTSCSSFLHGSLTPMLLNDIVQKRFTCGHDLAYTDPVITFLVMNAQTAEWTTHLDLPDHAKHCQQIFDRLHKTRFSARQIQTLIIYNHRDSAPALKFLRSHCQVLQKLEILQFDQTKLSLKNDLSHVSGSLRSLQLGTELVDPPNFCFFSSNLREVEFLGSHNFTLENFRHVKHLKSLQTLILNQLTSFHVDPKSEKDVAICEEVFSALAGSLLTLRVLRCGGMRDALAVRHLVNLRELVMKRDAHAGPHVHGTEKWNDFGGFPHLQVFAWNYLMPPDDDDNNKAYLSFLSNVHTSNSLRHFEYAATSVWNTYPEAQRIVAPALRNHRSTLRKVELRYLAKCAGVSNEIAKLSAVQDVTLADCSFFPAEESEEAVDDEEVSLDPWEIAAKNLKSLCFVGLAALDTLQFIAPVFTTSGGRNLKNLSLSGNTLHDVTVRDLEKTFGLDNKSEDDLQNNSNVRPRMIIEKLNLSVTSAYTEILKTLAKGFVKRGIAIERLAASFAGKGFTDEVLEVFVVGSSEHLWELSCSYASVLTVKCLPTIVQHGKNLRVLEMPQQLCKDQIIDPLRDRCEIRSY